MPGGASSAAAAPALCPVASEAALAGGLDVTVKGLLLDVEGGVHLGLSKEAALGRWRDRAASDGEDEREAGQ